MKRIIFLIFFVLIIFSVNGIELWNGFNTEMTQDMIITRMIELFNIEKPASIKNNESYVTISVHYNLIPQPTISLHYDLRNTNSYSGIKFYIINDKLYAIGINWKADFDTLYSNMLKQFGNYSDIKNSEWKDNFGYITYYKTFKWDKKEKYIYLSSGGYSGRNTFFVDRIVTDNFLKEKEEEKTKKEQQEKARQKAANDGVVF